MSDERVPLRSVPKPDDDSLDDAYYLRAGNRLGRLGIGAFHGLKPTERSRELEGRLKAFFKRFRYKSGWFFEVMEADCDSVMVKITYHATDVATGKQTLIVSSRIFHAALLRIPNEDFLKIVRNELVKAEMHEMNEWIMFDGVRVFDPHKGGED